MKRRLALIINRPASRSVLPLFVILVLLLTGCEVDSRDQGASSETAPESAPVITATSSESIPSPVSMSNDYVVERVALATNVNSDGSPIEELAVIPANARNVFISVLVSNFREELTVRAFWFEGSTIISQSESIVEPSGDSATWVALGLQVIENFDYNLTHSVELRINGQKFESYPFRIGSEKLQDLIVFSTMALGTDASGDPIAQGNAFDLFAGTFVAVIRVSTEAATPALQFHALLYREDILIRQATPDGGQPVFDPGDDSNEHQITFTFPVDDSLVPGEYSVSVLINGAETVVLPFTVLEGRVPTSTPAPTATPAPTSTPFVSGVSLIEAAIVESMDTETGEPSGDPLRTYRVEDGASEAKLIAAVNLSDLRIDDVVEFDVILYGKFVSRQRYPVAAFEEGWLSVPISLATPSSPGSSNPYEILFYVNGTRARTVNISISAS